MLRDDLQDYKEDFDLWFEAYSPMEFLEYDGEDGENFARAKSTANQFVWTSHGTCEDNVVSAGFAFFGDPPRCCWDTHGWYISKTPSMNISPKDFESYKTSYYCECECYDEETEAGEEGCEQCEGDGWTHYYFD